MIPLVQKFKHQAEVGMYVLDKIMFYSIDVKLFSPATVESSSKQTSRGQKCRGNAMQHFIQIMWY